MAAYATGASPGDAVRAFVVEGTDGSGPVRRGLRDLRLDDLPPGEVVVAVEWSSVNFKDGLAATAGGRVARTSPLVPGIDLAGTVVASEASGIAPGQPVVVHGYDLGTSRHGGYATLARVPAGWVVPLPGGLAAREAMAIGTAGFTAAMAVQSLEAHGIGPSAGPVIVTGASGGVGGAAVDLLAARGHEVWAVTGKPDQAARLRELGAAGFVERAELERPGRPLEHARWAAAVDTVGGPSLPGLLRSMRPGGLVAACGNAGGAALEATVFPFILRGVAIHGMDSGFLPIEARRALWRRLATDLRPRHLGDAITEVDLDGLEDCLDRIVAGEARGRWIVRLAG